MITYRAATLLARPLTWLVFRPQLCGVEHLPREGGFVVACNHLSGFDAFAIAYPLGSRSVRNMAKNQLFHRRFLGPLVRNLGGFPARSEDGLAGGVDEAARLARSGDVVVIFPEGVRRRAGQEHQPRMGAASAALVAGVPLVPAAIRGTDGWRERRRWRILFGPPIALDEGKTARSATTELWQEITRLEAALD